VAPSPTCWILSDGKVGDENPCFGLATAMGLAAERRLVRPHPFFAALAPWGPIDPRDAPDRPDSPLRPPFPAIAIASGRRTVPYLRRLKRLAGRQTFTIFLKDPRSGAGAADVVWVPDHDALRGPNVITSIAAPHLVSAAALASARRTPDPRLAGLRPPRVALLVGGPSRHHPFGAADQEGLIALAQTVLASGASLMATPSRRTPPALVARLRALAGDQLFLWDGLGGNPYIPMLALADTVIVTADSTNMVGEAIATSAPVHIFEPAGGHRRLDAFIEALVASGRVRRWRGALEGWPVVPVDVTPKIAAEIGRRFALFQQGGQRNLAP
jgi:mitochondrial fission protein ELM1